MPSDTEYIRLALRLAQRADGLTSPNPMVGAVLVKHRRILGRGWHHRAGKPHAEIEALNDAARKGNSPKGATLYVTLEPCSTSGRTPACTEAIIAAGIRRVVLGATDPNPEHCGRGLRLLRRAGLAVTEGVLAGECLALNEAFNHWIVHRTPFVTVKAAMTLDGKIATADGESKWITGEPARSCGMKLRHASDAILVGINTILADDPSLTYRGPGGAANPQKRLRRIILDSQARTPLKAKLVTDADRSLTTVVVSRLAPASRVQALRKRVNVWVAPAGRRRGPGRRAGIDLRWVCRRLGSEGVTSLLVEGGGEVNASVLLEGRAHRVAFFYAPKILGGRKARPAVGGEGARTLQEMIALTEIKWLRVGRDWLLTARCEGNKT
jgi:diaminohydroxyphosphoribosylaminopyrimidine deaminase/5-amino-6-(5-phosphoribosylamino)uracil reductase